RPDETTRPRRLELDKSARVKFARIIQARSSFAPERLAFEKSEPTSFAPKRLAPDRFAPLKSTLLRSMLSSDCPDKSAGRSRDATASTARTPSALRSLAKASGSDT